jgi:hypothetical protein
MQSQLPDVFQRRTSTKDVLLSEAWRPLKEISEGSCRPSESCDCMNVRKYILGPGCLWIIPSIRRSEISTSFQEECKTDLTFISSSTMIVSSLMHMHELLFICCYIHAIIGDYCMN